MYYTHQFVKVPPEIITEKTVKTKLFLPVNSIVESVTQAVGGFYANCSVSKFGGELETHLLILATGDKEVNVPVRYIGSVQVYGMVHVLQLSVLKNLSFESQRALGEIKEIYS